MAFVHKYVVDTHLLEVNDGILILVHLVLDSGNLCGKVFLALDKTFEYTTRHIMPLLLHHFEVLINCIKFRLKDLLLHLQRLRYLAELVVGHYHAVVVIVLDLVEEIDSVIRLGTDVV